MIALPAIFAALLAGTSTPLLVSSAHATVTMDWVPVGNPGNAPDTASNCYSANCGQVNYNYYISKYDTTNPQYAEFLNAVDPGGSNSLGLYDTHMSIDTNSGGISLVSGNPSGSKYVVNSGFADKPAVYVTFYDALRFANWLNNGQASGSTETGAYTLLGGTPTPSNGLTVTRNRGATVFLPSENEWYKAAYVNGTSYFAYPLGTSTPTMCAASGPTPNTANCNYAVRTVTDVGAYTGSASPYGAYDMGGNVFQWNEQQVSGLYRGCRGGGWREYAFTLAASDPIYSTPTSGVDILGFRVASLVPEPGTGLLVMAGVLGLAIKRRASA